MFRHCFLLLGSSLLCLFGVLIFRISCLKRVYEKLQEKEQQLEEQMNISIDISYDEMRKKVSLEQQLLDHLQNTIATLEQQKEDIIEKRIQSLSEAKEIYLTFDDGPSDLTEKNLDILKKYNVKATFFIVHTQEKYHDLLKRMVEEGHSIGLHSYSHDYRKMYASVDDFFLEVEKLQEEVKEITGKQVNIIRFPGGSSNTISRFSPGIMQTLTKEVVKRGYRYYDWNLSSGDASSIGVRQFVKNSTNNKGKTAIMLLMHDSATKKVTTQGLEQVIQYYLDAGYDFKPITMHSSMFAHKVRN